MASTSDLQKIINKIIGVKNFILGGTDATTIGNTGDRLKVSADIVSTSGNVSPAFSPKVRVDVVTANVTLTTGSFTTFYTYSGTGLLHGFNAEFNSNAVIVRLQIDGETIFTGNSISDLNALLATGNDAARRQAGTGIVTSGATIDWSLKHPIKFASNVTISADANGGIIFTRNFDQGIFYISKET